MKSLKYLAATFCVAVVSLSATAQVEQSSYSMMGYGVLNDHVSASQRAMGGIGYALRSSRQINVKNPASYAAIDTMTFLFDIGADVGSVHASQEGLGANKTLGGLDYVTMQVPIGKWMGASIGMLPYSSVGYKFGNVIPNGESTYQGSGGISEAYLGFAARPVKGLSLGFNIGYLWGNVINDVYVSNESGASMALYERVMKVKDYNLQFGIQYGVTFARKNTLTLGVTYTLGHDVHGRGYGVKYDVGQQSNKPDTIGEGGLKNRFTLPWSVGAGIAYQWDNRLTVGADFTYQPWADAKFEGIKDFSNPLNFANRTKANFGAEFIPAHRGNYFKRIAYRVGAYYGQDYMMIDTNNVREFGVTCGFGLPTPLRTAINIGFEYRHRSTTPVATVSENYFMFTLGIALNEVWFVPSKIR